jgi:hypothetical protein
VTDIGGPAERSALAKVLRDTVRRGALKATAKAVSVTAGPDAEWISAKVLRDSARPAVRWV